jgi:4-hydroxythreonine-4-phosphate dehydrogenase
VRSHKPSLAISLGDPAGIGPDVVAAAAASNKVRRACRMTVFGDARVLESARRLVAGHGADAIENVVEVGRLRFRAERPRPGKSRGDAAFRYLEAAAEATIQRRYDALVTAPINKLWLARAGHRYDGHTEYLSKIAGRPATMMLTGAKLRVVLVTTHLALRAVSKRLTSDAVVSTASAVIDHLREYEGIGRPRIAVAALNPHGGEGGLFGDEEAKIIAPAVRRLARTAAEVCGPLPADTLFAAAAAGDYDAVVCMYHDQALIPLKLLEFGRGVNVSMGLPFIRTSPDHGTAYELAGTGRANPQSMIEAVLLAASMARHRLSRRKP